MRTLSAKKSSSSSTDKSLEVLSRLLLPPDGADAPASPIAMVFASDLAQLTRNDFDDVVALSSSHHVLMRGLGRFLRLMRRAANPERVQWANDAIETERARIENAMSFLRAICITFEEQGFDITVIKSLDHWPDLGSDLDLYTNANSSDVIDLMKRHFAAQVAPRSWGDRLAHKWNFAIAGLPEAVEIHMGRLGQTGEQLTIANGLAERARPALVGGHVFRVPAIADRLMISTLQRMYRHFYFRLCDIVDSAGLAQTGMIDYEGLRSAAEAAGIWEGVATYLAIVSDYIEQFQGESFELPEFVRAAARFGGEKLSFYRGFLRVPIVPQSARLYASQLGKLFLSRELKSTARLSLLPCLATAAALGQKITGSDKGVW